MESKYYWWTLRGTLKYYLAVLTLALMVGPSNVRVEFHPEAPDGPWAGQPVHRVINAKTGKLYGEYNEVWTCPPRCE